MAQKLVFLSEELRSYVIRTFTHLGVPDQDAKIAADVILAADLRGVDSHGIIRLHSYYTNGLMMGRINPLSPCHTIHETLTTAAIDGESGLGQVVSYKAMETCLEKARQTGVGMVTVRNSNHYGIAAYYAMMALQEDMIGISFTNSQPLVAPTYGKTALLGTNPIAVAVPAGTQRPYVLDMATSIVPIGRITVFQKAGKEIPVGWGIDQDGVPTSNPDAVLNGGALMPLGGIDLMRGYKGYGLALWVDIFSGILSGAAFGPFVGHPTDRERTNVGHYFAAIRLDAFRPVDEFKKDMDQMIQTIKDSPKAAGQDRIYIAGEKEYELSERYQRDGIPLMEEVVKNLKTGGNEVGEPFDLEPVGVIQV